MAIAQRFNNNPRALSGAQSGVNLSLKDIIPLQPISQNTAVADEVATIGQLQTIPYGTATLSGTTYTVTLLNYPLDFDLLVGGKILVKFSNGYSGGNALSLKIGNKTIAMLEQGVALTSIAQNQIIEFTFVGTITDGEHNVTQANASAGITSNTLNGALANWKALTIQNVDVNTIEETCVKYVQAGTNTPTGSRYGYLYVTKREDNSNYVRQIWANVGSSDTYIRVKNNGVWSAWQKLTTQSDLQNYAYIDGDTLVIGDNSKSLTNNIFQTDLIASNEEKTFSINGFTHFKIEVVIGYSSGIIKIVEIYRQRNSYYINTIKDGSVTVTVELPNYNTANIKLLTSDSYMAYITGFAHN